MMSSSGEYDTEENKYPLELLNEDIDRMLNSDEFINALNALKTEKEVDNDDDDDDDDDDDSMSSSGGYDTEENKYPVELLNEDIDRMLNSDEFINALNALKTATEKEVERG